MKHRWTAALLALALVLALPFSAAAETFSTEDFTMEIPEGTYVFTPTTSTEDPNWAMAGVANPESELSTLAEMNGVAELVTEDGETTILVQQQESDQTQAYFNLRYLTEKQQADFLDAIMQSQTDEITVDKYYLDVDGQPFYRIRIDGTYQETGYHELIYGTIVNGFTLAFNIYGGEESVTPGAGGPAAGHCGERAVLRNPPQARDHRGHLGHWSPPSPCWCCWCWSS